MNFWERYTKICEEKKRSATSVLVDLGLSKGNAARWKNGGSPTLKTASKIAEYLGVSLDDLVADRNQELHPENGKEQNLIERHE